MSALPASTSGAALLILAVAVPLGLTALLALPGTAGRAALRLSPWAALPALVLALAGSPASLDLPWLLLGSRLAVDGTGSIFLLLTGALWLAAGVYAAGYLAGEPGERRYFAYHLLTLTGNLGVVLASDVVTFYLAFVLMTLAAFGLIVHEGTPAARRAGVVYLAMAIAAEGLLLFGLVAAADRGGAGRAAAGGGLLGEAVAVPALPALGGTPVVGTAVLLLLLGFGVKAGLPLLHMWLPLAHPIAPTPASAVLSGAMIKAGLLGWLRFLPLGEASLPALGTALAAVGVSAAYLAAFAGFTQRDPKVLLAYSSISQMGLMTLGVAAALAYPEAAPAAVAAVALYALHHALAKGALFLGVGIARRTFAPSAAPGRRWRAWLLWIGMVLAAGAIAGLPVTGGALGKALLHEAVEHSSLPHAFARLQTLSVVTTTLLMMRFLQLLRRLRPERGATRAPPGMWLGWAATASAVFYAAPLAAAARGLPLSGFEPDAAKALESLWPIALGVAAYLPLSRLRLPIVPAGDVLVSVEWVVMRSSSLLQQIGKRLAASSGSDSPVSRLNRYLRRTDWLQPLESNLMRWDNAGGLWLLLGVLLAAALWGVAGG